MNDLVCSNGGGLQRKCLIDLVEKLYQQGRADALKPISDLASHYLIDDEARAVVILDAIRNYISGQLGREE